ncbi:hypothetical protein MLD38_012550 [Melastoma candidum]|uniref:Uncharacterized protein n=1 Tax=Melastoma candidum TaxID=119954 RepID=A0ACB9R7A4_9MYRT|nr:hypothetical protein MLD38_012550 [Melastoma candidum]
MTSSLSLTTPPPPLRPRLLPCRGFRVLDGGGTGSAAGFPDRNRVEFWVVEKSSGCFEYKMEVKFENVMECVGCRLDESERVVSIW